MKFFDRMGLFEKPKFDDVPNILTWILIILMGLNIGLNGMILNYDTHKSKMYNYFVSYHVKSLNGDYTGNSGIWIPTKIKKFTDIQLLRGEMNKRFGYARRMILNYKLLDTNND